MRKRITCIILSLILAFGLLPIGSFADDDDPPESFGSKEARLEDNENTVAIDITTQCLEPPKVLVYQGSYCTAHNLEIDTIFNGINSVLPFADVDYYADAKQYNSTERITKELKHFKKGSRITPDDIYKLRTTSGMHIVTQGCLDNLMSTLEKGDYDYLVMILDGAMSTGLSGGKTQEIFDEKYKMRLTDEQYKARRAYAEKLSDTDVLYLVAPKYNKDDIVMYYDNWNNPYTYNLRRQYWAEKYFSEKNTTESLGYLNAHLFVEGLAFLAPDYYLTLTDPETGKVTCDTPPAPGDIGYDTDHIVYYDLAGQVAEKMGDIQKTVLPYTLTISDVLADGLEYRSSAVEYSDDGGVTWTEVDDNLVKITKDGNILTAEIDLSDLAFAKNRFRFLIKADVTETFGETIKTGKTNGDCDIVYTSKDGSVVEEYEPDPPEVSFTTFDVFYNEGDHGALTGKESETFRQYAPNSGTTTGSSVAPDLNYIHTGWSCDDDVTFEDGTTAEEGTLLSDDQIASVVPTHTITFTALYMPVTKTVTYVVDPDLTWNVPDDSNTPLPSEHPYASDVEVEDDLSTTQGFARDKDGKIVEGSWKFTPWDKEDFVIYEDTTITGAWKFNPRDLTVTYVVDPDPTWVVPDDSNTPSPSEHPYASDVEVEDDLSTTQSFARDKDGKIAEGVWEFTPWDKEDFVIYKDTTITGAWKFNPEPADDPGSDEPMDDPGSDEPIVDPGSDEPIDDPGSDEPIVNPGSDEPMDDPGSDEPIVDPGSDEPIDDPGSDEPETGDPGIFIPVITLLLSLLALTSLVFKRKKE